MEDRLRNREGGDIFAADMIQPEQDSKIAAEFENTTVFLTGGTGFIGKLFLEKLLRISKTVKVLVLVRPKKGKDTATRFQEIFEGPNMVPLKVKNPNFGRQICLINGDCTQKDLGLSEEDQQLLIEEVNFVIHCAATVRFDEDLKTAAHINVRAVKDLIAIAKRMKDLRAFLHISTAYSFCPQKHIGEEFYEPGMTGDDILHMVETMNENRLTAITPALIREWPNTYVFTKAIAEDVLKKEFGRLPIAILRPSIVIASKAEPVSGWVDNFFGPTGILLAVGLGFSRTVIIDPDKKADVIPADFVTNAGFAILWDISQRRSLNDNAEIPCEKKDDAIPIFNAVSSAESPITWGHYSDMAHKNGRKIPSEMQVWYPMNIYFVNARLKAITSFFLETIPGYLVDGVCLCLGKKPMMIKTYRKVEKYSEVISFFTLREWKFENGNLRALWNRLGPEDQTLYPFSMANFDWTSYMYFYVRGIRVYLLKDPLETLPKGKFKFKILTILHFSVVTVLSVILSFTLLYYFLKFYFRMSGW